MATIIDGYSIQAIGDKLALLPTAAIQDVGQNGTTSATARGRINMIGPVVEDNSGANSKDVLPYIFISNTANFTMANVATAQSPFAAAVDTITVEASTSYFFDALIHITGMGGGTRTTATLFGGTATFTSIRYYAMIQTGAALALGTLQTTKMNEVATAMVLNTTVTTAAAAIRMNGIMRINGAGTLIPQIQFSADPTGTILCSADSYFRLTACGSNTRASAGTVA